MTAILAIDPGTEQSGWVLYEPGGHRLRSSGVLPNATILSMVERTAGAHPDVTHMAVEMIQSYGMPVGQEVFETCVWIGRFQQSWRAPRDVMLVYRQAVKLLLCGLPRAKDANVRQALIDLWPRTGGGKIGQIGTKGKPGPLFGVSTHAWPALGVALVAAEQVKRPNQRRRIEISNPRRSIEI